MQRLLQLQRLAVAPVRRWMSSLPAHEVVGLPALSPTMEQGVIASWKVKEGMAYAAGDVICEIETDKANVDFEAQDDGIVAKILAQEGKEVTVGAPIMVIVEDANDISAFDDFSPLAKEAASPAPAPAAASPAPAPAPAAEAPTPAPAAAEPTPAPAPIAPPPAPPATSGSESSMMVFIRADADLPLVKGPLATIISQQKETYHSKYGITGF